MDHPAMKDMNSPSAVFELENSSVILFAGWTTGTTKGLVAAVLLSTAVAALFEGLLELRHIQRLSMTIRVTKCTDCRPSMISYTRHSIQTFLHVCQVLLGYILMLSVMTFNVWVLVGISIGAGIGHYLVRPIVDVMFSKTEDREMFIRDVRRWKRREDDEFHETVSAASEDAENAEDETLVMYVSTV